MYTLKPNADNKKDKRNEDSIFKKPSNPCILKKTVSHENKSNSPISPRNSSESLSSDQRGSTKRMLDTSMITASKKYKSTSQDLKKQVDSHKLMDKSMIPSTSKIDDIFDDTLFESDFKNVPSNSCISKKTVFYENKSNFTTNSPMSPRNSSESSESLSSDQRGSTKRMLDTSMITATKKYKSTSQDLKKQVHSHRLMDKSMIPLTSKIDDIFDDTLFEFDFKNVRKSVPGGNMEEDALTLSQQNEFIINDPFQDIVTVAPVQTNSRIPKELDDFQFTQYCNNSQFMNQIENMITNINKVQKSQRSQPLKNISNLEKFVRSPSQKKSPERSADFDTTFNNSLADILKSTQYKQSVQDTFDNVAKSICGPPSDDVFNVTAAEIPASRRDKVEEAIEKTFGSTEAMKKVLRHANESYNLNKENIEWPDDSLFRDGSGVGPILRNALGDNIDKSLTQNRLSNLTIIEKEGDEQFLKHGDFFDLPERVRDLLKAYRSIDKLYDWQIECLQLPAISARKNLVYALPTSGGKTLVAEILVLREILCRKKNALFVLPYVAIVQEKVWAMSPFAVAMEFLIEEYAAGKGNYPPRPRKRKNSLFICTIEKALGLINSLIEHGRTDEVGMIVVDELHLLGDGVRGVVLETLLTKVKLLQSNIQIIGMSATIGNMGEICEFLNADMYSTDFRPVELVEHVKCQHEIARVNKNADDVDTVLTLTKTVNYYKKKPKLDKIDPDQLGGLVMDVIPESSCLIFCKTRVNCENVAKLLAAVLPPDLKNARSKEKLQMLSGLQEECGTLCPILKDTIQMGIAYHHSGLTSEERRIIEEGFRGGVLSVICCTSTLAAGVNLPAKRVIIRNPYIGRDFINLSRYKQMIGRAGRAGFEETGESILICAPNELPRIKAMLMAPMDVAVSYMSDDAAVGLQNFMLSCVALGLAKTKDQLHMCIQSTLLQVQAERLGIDTRKLMRAALKALFHMGALKTAVMDENCAMDNSISAEILDETFDSTDSLSQHSQPRNKRSERPKLKVNLDNRTELKISQLGAAAIKGGLDLKRAHELYEDLLRAQASLVLFTGLHLMYLVTPYSISEQVFPSKSIYYSIYTKLSAKEVQTAKVLGLNDQVAGKMLMQRQITEISESVLKRFYVTLMLYDLWNEMSVYDVSQKYEVNRGLVQNLMTNAATFASNVYHFCCEFEDFWPFSLLLKGMSDRLSHCCIKELIPLMKLPAVKQNRAKQLFNAGYKTLQSIARADPEKLVTEIDFMNRKLANQLIAAAKMILLEKVENLREEAEDCLDGIDFNV